MNDEEFMRLGAPSGVASVSPAQSAPSSGSLMSDDEFMKMGSPDAQIAKVEAAPAKPKGGSAQEAFVSNFVNVPTMGLGRSLRAGLGVVAGDVREAMGKQRGNLGKSFDEEYQRVAAKEEAAKEAHPVASGAGMALGIPVAAATSPARLATIPGAMAAGAVSGALQGYGESGTGLGALGGAGLGAVGGVAGNAVGHALAPVVNKIGRSIPIGAGKTLIQKAEVPQTTEELFKGSSGIYKSLDNSGVRFKQSAIGNLADDLLVRLNKKTGFDQDYHKPVAKLVDDVRGLGLMPHFTQLEALRQRAIKELVTSPDPATRLMGAEIRSGINNFLDNISEKQLQKGSLKEARDAVASVKKARELWKQASKARQIEIAQEKAINQAGATYSGQNVNNATRQKIKDILNRHLDRPRGWTDEEVAAMQKVVHGDSLGNKARAVGNLLGPKGWFGAGEAMGTVYGLAMGHPWLAGLSMGAGALGHVSRKVAEKSTERNINDLLRTIQLGHAPHVPMTDEVMSGLGSILGGGGLPEEVIPVRRASGGRVDLVREAERTCKRLGGAAKPLMSLPDEHIVNALRLARGG